MNERYSLVPFVSIEAAVNGDVDSVKAVVRHYHDYIAKLCIQPLYDEQGNVRVRMNEEMRGQLETKLITKILLNFKMA